MRIGELAALLGVSTRTVRHYHHQGVLPEPPRRANGYREYGMRDAIALARVRRLVALGLSLDEVRDTVVDDQGRELPEILLEIDAGLARQEQEIRLRRSRLAELLTRAEAGTLGLDDTASPDLVAFLREVDIPASKAAAWDRDLLILMDTAAPPGERDHASSMFAKLAADPDLTARGHDFYRLLDDLSDAGRDDPRIAPLAATLAEFTTTHLISVSDQSPVDWEVEALDPFLDDLSPAQAEVIRQAVRLMAHGEPPGRSRRTPEPAEPRKTSGPHGEAPAP
ncbi:MerR family transcriptional regulator [Microtetraspora sp. NBRC 13810]|uniref:MerR family transcriptional regulator n=1 Tax=Microtetraspora sp. NBRC 13810 TaxID=3030990 RepID=UPI002555607B|nr:MerR family transcriptional regulator [Microtetraspora sp. NBRC 13810]GLW10194.1 MerR family transcriptional regulator [Microtetraspora sp. NBRC 13810]